LWLKKYWPTASQIAKIGIFGINLPKRGIPPYAIFTKFGLGKESQIRTLTPNFIVVALKV